MLRIVPDSIRKASCKLNQSVPCMSKAYAASVMDFVEG
jgi:hypothetical protein